MKQLSDIDFKQTYGDVPEGFHRRMQHTLRRTEEEKPMKRLSFRAVLITAISLITTMAIAFAASQLGWVDFFGGRYDVTVPKAAQEALSATTPRQYQLGPMTFTFKQLLADGRIALSAAEIHTTDNSVALYAPDTNFFEAVDAETDTVLNHYGLEPGTTWVDAAKQLNLPLYGIRALVEVDEPYMGSEAMEDILFSQDCSIVYFNMAMINAKNAKDTLPAKLYLAVTEFDLATSEVKEKWTAREGDSIPLAPMLNEKAYAPDAPTDIGGVTLTGVHAEQYSTGVYVDTSFIVPDGMDQDAATNAIFSLLLLDSEGDTLPAGMNLSKNVNLDAWPTVILETQSSLETLPDTLTVSDGVKQVMVK